MRMTSRATKLALTLGLVACSAHAQSNSRPTVESSETKKPVEGSAAKTESGAAIHPNPQAAKALKVGEALPTIPALKNAKGEAVNLAEATQGKTTVLVFYRGGWCPYCNTHLAELAKIQPELAAHGVQVLAISPDSVTTLAAYPAEKQQPYTLLSDSDHAAAIAFGVAFAVDAETQAKLKGYGIDLVKASGNPDQVLPVPSVFVINPEGKVAFSHANADYTTRLSGAEILKAAGIESADSGSGTKEVEPAHEEGSGSK